MNKLPRCLESAEKNALRAIEKVEFFQAKSTASYRKEAIKNWQGAAEFYADVAELLKELILYRNASPPNLNLNWGTRLAERNSDFAILPECDSQEPA